MIKNIYTIGFGLLAKLCLILSVILISKNISLEEFGTYEIAITSINLLFPILCGGMIDGIFRFCIGNEDRDSIFSRLFLVGIAFFCILSPFAYFVLNIYFSSDSSFVICVVVLLNYLLEAIKQFKKANKEIKYVTGMELCKNALFLLFVFIVFEYFRWKFTFEVLLLLQGISASVVLMVFSIESKIWNNIVLNRKVMRINKEEISYSLYMMPNSILWWVMNASDKFILGAINGPASVAIYAVATKFPSLITALNRIFIQIWHVSIVSDDQKKSNKWLLNFTVLNFSFIFLSYFFYYTFDFLFDERYAEASIYLQYLLVGSYYSVLASLLGGVFMRDKKVNIALFSTLFSASINVLLNFVFIPKFGTIACVISTVISLIILYVLRFIYISKYNIESLGFMINPLIHLPVILFPFFITNNNMTICFFLSVLCVFSTIKCFKDNCNVN
jgi:O-antigen/teichoic acid export membrane protein